MGKDLQGEEIGDGLDQLPSKMYRLRYRDNEGKRQTVVMRNLKALKSEQRKILLALETNTYTDPKLTDITLDKWFGIWIRSIEGRNGVKESTRAFYAEKYKLHVKPFLGDKRLRSLTVSVIREWMRTLEKQGRSQVTIKMAHRTLSACLGRKHGAESEERLPQGNPCRLVFCAPGDVEERASTYVTEEDFDAKLLPAYDDDEQMQRLILVAIFTGLRFGELAGLRRQDIDVAGERLRVVEGKYAFVGHEEYGIAGGISVEKPKGNKSRWVPYVPERALRALEEQLDEVCGPEPESLIFPSTTGTHLDYHNWHRRWSKGMRKAGMTGLRPHDLRHSAATWLVQRGMPIEQLQRLLGHTTPQMTWRYLETSDTDVAAALRKAWEKAAA